MAALAAGLLGAPGAAAQEAGFYAGGALGQSTYTDFCVSDPRVLSCEDTDTAWKLFGGYRFNRYVAIEGSYVDWGKVRGIVDPTGPAAPVDVPLSQTAKGVAVVGSIPLGPQFAVFAKLGHLWGEQETPGSASGNFKRDTDGTQYGIGAHFAFTPHWVARAEWERANLESEVELLSIGVEYRF